MIYTQCPSHKKCVCSFSFTTVSGKTLKLCFIKLKLAVETLSSYHRLFHSYSHFIQTLSTVISSLAVYYTTRIMDTTR